MGRKGARSSSGELRSPFVGALKFPASGREFQGRAVTFAARQFMSIFDIHGPLPLNRVRTDGIRPVQFFVRAAFRARTMRGLCGVGAP